MLFSFTLINLLAQISIRAFVIIRAYALFWLAVGILLCLMEVFLAKNLTTKYKFVPIITGVNALFLAIFLFRANIVPLFSFQIAYWMLVSTACVIWIRPMIRKRKKHIVQDAAEAKTLTAILPGEMGRVIYEGCSWQARCADRQLKIDSNQTVYVLRREGNTLIIAPENLFDI